MPSLTIDFDPDSGQIKLIANPPMMDEMTFWGLMGTAQKIWNTKDIAAKQAGSGLVVPMPRVPNGKGFTN